MVSFAKRFLRAVTYGFFIGIIFSMMFYFGTSFLTAISALPSSLSPSLMALVGFLFGFTGPVAIEWSKDIEAEQKT